MDVLSVLSRRINGFDEAKLRVSTEVDPALGSLIGLKAMQM